MRRAIAIAVASAAALGSTMLPARSAEADPVQSEAGTIAAPTRFTTPEQAYPGAGRRLYLANTATNGLVSFAFKVDPATWGGAFDLALATDVSGMADLGIYFYSDFGSMDPTAGNGDATTTAEYDATKVGGEKGFIPPGSTKGLVFMKTGANAVFAYTGFAPTTISLATGSLDLTVPNGAFVGWTNDTGDYAFVRHLPGAEEELLFDSSPEAATGIRNGETFTYQFTAPGSYRYETNRGVGTITVTDGSGAGTPAA